MSWLRLTSRYAKAAMPLPVPQAGRVPVSMLSDRSRVCKFGRAAEPHSGGNVPTRELLCSSRFCSWTMDEKDAGSVPAAQSVPQPLT